MYIWLKPRHFIKTAIEISIMINFSNVVTSFLAMTLHVSFRGTKQSHLGWFCSSLIHKYLNSYIQI
ncbi:Uncharacterised protein [Flavobacterium hibernum]|nr:Uncharacterised protein [Flavobacterium hibernum]